MLIQLSLGLNNFAITSDGSKYNNPKHLAKHQRNLKRKQKGSNSRQKVRRIEVKLARAKVDFGFY